MTLHRRALLKPKRRSRRKAEKATEPGSGARADSYRISGTTLLAVNRKETSRGQRFAELDFDDMKGNKPPTKARVYNLHKSLDPLFDFTLKKKCDILLHSEATKDKPDEYKFVLDDLILIDGVEYKQGRKADEDLDAAIDSFARERNINLDSEP